MIYCGLKQASGARSQSKLLPGGKIWEGWGLRGQVCAPLVMQIMFKKTRRHLRLRAANRRRVPAAPLWERGREKGKVPSPCKEPVARGAGRGGRARAALGGRGSQSSQCLSRKLLQKTWSAFL